MESQKSAVIVLSGGLDSTTTMGIAKEAGYKLYALTFDYGQRHRRELESAEAVASFYGAVHKVMVLGDLFAESALSEGTLRERPLSEGPLTERPAGETKEDLSSLGFVEQGQLLPATYVPARNVLFLALALSYAEKVKAEAIYMGVNALDNAGYPDCRPAFIEAFQQVVNCGTERGVLGKGVRLETPLIQLEKEEIVSLALQLQCPLHLTHTCYAGQYPACGQCASCVSRRDAFMRLGLVDPLPYQ
ncbi:7-cyano-7-deazaguanine synthase QueC [Heliorestis acidaminivorans]|uniref:7-cyano-7-deazaguanine synthase n=1 Tax=Heliorestis acidaminivorans TaxID=553427 RepID=A0A6I0EZY5_9FIRM|nr:7-cyano-7-deazaguanine synthase QueC [Heliorestis acidaminivorans]